MVDNTCGSCNSCKNQHKRNICIREGVFTFSFFGACDEWQERRPKCIV